MNHLVLIANTDQNGQPCEELRVAKYSNSYDQLDLLRQALEATGCLCLILDMSTGDTLETKGRRR